MLSFPTWCLAWDLRFNCVSSRDFTRRHSEHEERYNAVNTPYTLIACKLIKERFMTILTELTSPTITMLTNDKTINLRGVIAKKCSEKSLSSLAFFFPSSSLSFVAASYNIIFTIFVNALYQVKATIMLKVIMNRLNPQVEIIAKEQVGFRAGKAPQNRS